MLKRRLRLPLGAGLLRPYVAPTRTCPFSRPAAVARRSFSDDNFQYHDQDHLLQQQRQQQELYRQAMSQQQEQGQQEQYQRELYDQQQREAEAQQDQLRQQQFHEDQYRHQQAFQEQQLPRLQQLNEEQQPFRSLPTGFQLSKPAFADDFAKAGVTGLYSPYGYETVLGYQVNCVQQMNERIAGTKFAEYKSILDVALDTSREASLASIFNYASMAHNIGFYLDTISDKGVNAALPDEHAYADKTKSQDEYAHIPKPLQDELNRAFGSITNLRREMLEQANAMFGPGFVWLVRVSPRAGSYTSSGYRVLATYQAGSPYPRAHWRMQGTDMNLQAGVTDRQGATINDYFNRMNAAKGREQLHGQEAEAAMLDPLRKGNPGAAELTPILCVSTWEHAWMVDWGVYQKRGFLDAWWNAIQWEKVHDRVLVLDTGRRKMGVHPPRMAGAGSPQDVAPPPADAPFQPSPGSY